MAENGNGHAQPDPQQQLATLQRAFIALDGLADRLQLGGRLGYSYQGARNVYDALGWPQTLSYSDYYSFYSRSDIAGRIVDLPVDACWREGFEIDDEADKPDFETPFAKAWVELDKRLRLTSWLTRLDRLSGIGQYAVLFVGVRGQDPAQPLGKVNADAIAYASIFTEPNAIIDRLDTDPQSERFGLPDQYSLTTADLAGMASSGGGVRQVRQGRAAQVHWSRVIHAAEALEDTKVFGRPRLQRVYNLLSSLQLVVGGSGEAFWRSARPRYHANIGKDAQGYISPEELEGLGDQLAKMVHNFQDWIRTSYTDINQMAATPADPSGHVAVILDLVSASTGIPKRILLGSERGELASSQDAQEWSHRVAERQASYVEPTLVRPLIDRLVEAGALPEPSGGEYDVVWPDITGPSADQRAALAEHVTSAEAKHAQAEMLGKPSVTRNELRELLGLDPIEAMEEDVPGETPPLPSKPAPPPVVVHPPGQPPQVGPDGKPVPAPGAPQKTPTQPDQQPAKAAGAQSGGPFVGADADADPAALTWDESKHPRVPGGSGDPSGEWTGSDRITISTGDHFLHKPSGTIVNVKTIKRSGKTTREYKDVIFDVYHHGPGADQPPNTISRFELFKSIRSGEYVELGQLQSGRDSKGRHIERFTKRQPTSTPGGSIDPNAPRFPQWEKVTASEAQIDIMDDQAAAEAQSGGPFVGADADADLRVNSLFATIMAAVNAATDRIFGAATMDAVRAALNDLTGRVVERFGAPGQEPDLATRAAVEFMAGFGANRVTDIGDTTRELLRDTLTEGLRNGETQQQLAARTRAYFRGISAGRAKVIAATETANAVNHGMFVGMVAAGVIAKVWRTQQDEKVRPTHVELDGQIRHLGDPFVIPSNGLEAMRPSGFGIASEDVGCRCIAEPAGNMPPGGLAANAGDQEWPRRLAVHERRVLAAVRRGLRAQEAAVLAVLAGGGAPVVQAEDDDGEEKEGA